MPSNLPGERGKPLGNMASRAKRMGSCYFAVIQPVGDLVRVITPLATYSVRWDVPRTSPFP